MLQAELRSLEDDLRIILSLELVARPRSASLRFSLPAHHEKLAMAVAIAPRQP